ncbi:hypothetical protein V6N12_027323 [Hibiscus sabdariffa]|uniref:Uncharacterized protein n=1 Tax=Hibiscus sabdariffa TaxID=183260 RepID=A0ABR2DUH2_9ROSI
MKESNRNSPSQQSKTKTWVVQRDASDSDGAEELIKLGLGFRVHADDDHQRNKAIVSYHFGLFNSPCAPLFKALCA